jgi:hypothetical protein
VSPYHQIKSAQIHYKRQDNVKEKQDASKLWTKIRAVPLKLEQLERVGEYV